MDLLQTQLLDCPYCGENIQVVVDCSVSEQNYIEDCQVCCRPINFYINAIDDYVDIKVTSENE